MRLSVRTFTGGSSPKMNTKRILNVWIAAPFSKREKPRKTPVAAPKRSATHKDRVENRTPQPASFMAACGGHTTFLIRWFSLPKLT
jgi:hypothetical protein